MAEARIAKSDAQWRQELTPEQYNILRQKGTERPFTGEYYHNQAAGSYLCAACGQELFSAAAKYESGSGWPSYWQPVNASAVETQRDSSHFMVRTEVMCSRCGGHLGHLFDDGPRPTGLRYCINSASLQFRPAAEEESSE
jgi:peptide-methionine (R)-S-oxide reductase